VKAVDAICQICSRAIRAPQGIVAHHGYQRPFGWGQQTPSCHGSLKQPYQASIDDLKSFAKSVRRMIAAMTRELTTIDAESVSQQERIDHARIARDIRHAQFDLDVYDARIEAWKGPVPFDAAPLDREAVRKARVPRPVLTHCGLCAEPLLKKGDARKGACEGCTWDFSVLRDRVDSAKHHEEAKGYEWAATEEIQLRLTGLVQDHLSKIARHAFKMIKNGAARGHHTDMASLNTLDEAQALLREWRKAKKAAAWKESK